MDSRAAFFGAAYRRLLRVQRKTFFGDFEMLSIIHRDTRNFFDSTIPTLKDEESTSKFLKDVEETASIIEKNIAQVVLKDEPTEKPVFELAIDPERHELADNKGGQKKLEKQKIRPCVGPNADPIFEEYRKEAEKYAAFEAAAMSWHQSKKTETQERSETKAESAKNSD